MLARPAQFRPRAPEPTTHHTGRRRNSDPLFQARSGRVRRKTPVLLHCQESTLVEGVVDLGFCQETSDFNGWAVVDFRLGVHRRRKRGWLEGLKADLTLRALGC